MKKAVLLFFGILFISACNDKTYTVEDFMKDDDLRKSFLSKCDNGELHNQELNCLNSRKAERDKVMLNSITEHGTKF